MEVINETDLKSMYEHFRGLAYCCSKSIVDELKIEKYMIETVDDLFFFHGYKIKPELAGYVHIRKMQNYGKSKDEKLLYGGCMLDEDYINRSRILYPLALKIANRQMKYDDYIENPYCRFFDSVTYTGHKLIVKFDSGH